MCCRVPSSYGCKKKCGGLQLAEGQPTGLVCRACKMNEGKTERTDLCDVLEEVGGHKLGSKGVVTQQSVSFGA